jgi:hypothetical protein
MDKNSLQDLLAKLQREATEALRDDPKSRESLSGPMQDLDRLSETDESLPDRLERIAVQFEADHPTLAASARRLVDLLGEVGI